MEEGAGKVQSLTDILEMAKPHVVLLQETGLLASERFRLPGYQYPGGQLYRARPEQPDRLAFGGVATYARDRELERLEPPEQPDGADTANRLQHWAQSSDYLCDLGKLHAPHHLSCASL